MALLDANNVMPVFGDSELAATPDKTTALSCFLPSIATSLFVGAYLRKKKHGWPTSIIGALAAGKIVEIICGKVVS